MRALRVSSAGGLKPSALSDDGNVGKTSHRSVRVQLRQGMR
jgi:hypothetical protein